MPQRLQAAPLIALAQVVFGPDQPKALRLRQLLALQWLSRTEGGVVATPAGHEALRLAAVEAEALGSEALGDYNASRERGRHDIAERHLARSQKYLDLANVLRGK